MMDIRPSGRERRLVGAILVLATVVLFFVAINLVASAVGYFGDILLAFFLAWLLAFIISPIVVRIAAAIPGLPHVVATVVVYTVIVAALVVLLLVVAQALANSISQFAASIPNIRSDLPGIVAPIQGWLDSVGLGQVDVAAQALVLLGNFDDIAPAQCSRGMGYERKAGKADRARFGEINAIAQIKMIIHDMRSHPLGQNMRIFGGGGTRDDKKFFTAPANQIIGFPENMS